jgi:hypothetical protein
VGAVVAGLLAAGCYAVAALLRSTYPFGPTNRNTNDLGQQFVPMYAHYRDVLTGAAHGDFVLTWAGGFGVPLIGDFMSYLGSTLSWMVVLLPRDRIDLSLFLITLVAFGLAASAMTVYLRRLRPGGPLWVAVLLGVSYSLCGWGVEQGVYMTVWMNGMIAFPVLAFLGDWMVTRRSVVAFAVTPFVVALLWTSHFYTVYMATIGAGLVTLARVVTMGQEVPWRTRFGSLAGAVAALGLGIGLTSPLLVPTFRAVQFSRPSPDTEFSPVPLADFLTRLLPGTAGVGVTPGIAVGTVALLLALSLPLNPRVATRERIAWPALTALMVLSMQLAPTMTVWHAFDTPNGSSYRQSFVLAGLLVIGAWISAAAGIRHLVTVVVPLLLLALGYLLALDAPAVTATTRLVVPAVAVVSLVAWWVLRTSTGAAGVLRPLAVAGVVLAVTGETALATAAVEERRAEVLAAFAPWGERNDRVRELVLEADRWPEHRVSPGRHTSANDPLLIGGQGSEYYSSTIPDALSEAFVDLGFGYSSYGRAPTDPANPVVDSVFAVAARVVTGPTGEGVGALTLARREVAPLVTVRAPRAPSSDPVPFGPQETALGADVYEVPEVSADYPAGLNATARRGGEIVLTPLGGAPDPLDLPLSARCPPGSEVFLNAPKLVGQVQVDGSWETVLRPTAKRPGIYTGAPLHHVGTVGEDGVVEVVLRLTHPTRMPASAIGCLDETALATAVAELRDRAPEEVVVGGHSVEVSTAPVGTAREVVLAVVRTPGWICAAGEGPRRPPGSLSGLISVPLPAGETEVSCTFRPRGLRMGLALGAVSLLGVGVLTLVVARLRRRDVTA